MMCKPACLFLSLVMLRGPGGYQLREQSSIDVFMQPTHTCQIRVTWGRLSTYRQLRPYVLLAILDKLVILAYLLQGIQPGAIGHGLNAADRLHFLVLYDLLREQERKKKINECFILFSLFPCTQIGPGHSNNKVLLC